MVSKKIKVFIPSSGEKAFLYQQTQDLTSCISDATPISVLLEKSTKNEINNYAVTFIVGSPPFNITSKGEHKDFLEACISAKNQMKNKLTKIGQRLETNNSERNKFIKEIKKNPYIH